MSDNSRDAIGDIGTANEDRASQHKALRTLVTS